MEEPKPKPSIKAQLSKFFNSQDKDNRTLKERINSDIAEKKEGLVHCTVCYTAIDPDKAINAGSYEDEADGHQGTYWLCTDPECQTFFNHNQAQQN